MPIKSLEDLYTLLYNNAYYEEKELVLNSYDTIYNNFNLNTIDEILDFLKNYLVISKAQEDNFKNVYSQRNYEISSLGYYIDVVGAIESLFDISSYNNWVLCDKCICLILAILYWDDILQIIKTKD